MAISNVTKSVAIPTTQYIGHPANNGIGSGGHWYTYIPNDPTNRTLTASIVPRYWDSATPLLSGLDSEEVEGTFALVRDIYGTDSSYFHNGVIEYIGAGTNDITSDVEDDAYMFAHLGIYDSVSQVSDDALYWDRLYLAEGNTDWEYYQYHKHLPSNYGKYMDSRLVMNGNGFIVPEDKSFGYQIAVTAKTGGTTYYTVLARIHTPSIGGAHNSHNDVIMPATAGYNYLQGGIIKANSNRYHSFYLKNNSGDWDVYVRTYTNNAKSFSAEVQLGTYDLADPVFTPAEKTGVQNQYPIRASAGDVLSTKVYIPVIYNDGSGGYDLSIWCMDDADVISGTITKIDILTSQTIRPDCQLRTVGSKLYALVSNDSQQIKLYSFSSGDNSFTDEGVVLTNGSGSEYLRIHGFRYNSNNTKFYAIISGTKISGGTYDDQGLYSFNSTSSFTGYSHLDYNGDSNVFLVRASQDTGYLEYDNATGVITKRSGAEPEGIAVGKSILQFENQTPVFYDPYEVNSGANDRYFHGIYLKDGRRLFVGQTEKVVNTNGDNPTDILVSIIDENDKQIHFTCIPQGLESKNGADWLITALQDSDGKVWVGGYTKSEFVKKKDYQLHGWVRNLRDGNEKVNFTSHFSDNNGNIFLAGNQITDKYSFISKFGTDYDVAWTKKFNSGLGDSDYIYSITSDSDGNLYAAGKSKNAGEGGFDAYLLKTDSTGNLLFDYVYGLAGDQVCYDLAIVKDSVGTEKILMPVVNGTSTNFLILSNNGTVEQQVNVDSCIVTSVTTHDSASSFMFSGTDGSSIAKFGIGDISKAQLVQWVSKFSTGVSSSSVNDMKYLKKDGTGSYYIITGADSDKGFVSKVKVDAGFAGSSIVWAKDFASTEFTSVSIGNTKIDSADFHIDNLYVTGYTSSLSTNDYMNDTVVIASLDSSGTVRWQNNFGHMGVDRLSTITQDVTGTNFIVSGHSTSHSNGQDAIFARLPQSGFGTGRYNVEQSVSSAYIYRQSTLSVTTNSSTLSALAAPVNQSGSFNASSISPLDDSAVNYTVTNYDGAYGLNGAWQMMFAEFSLDGAQEILNSAAYKTHSADRENSVTVYDAPSLFTWYQAGTVGDGSADDGNVFLYEFIQAVLNSEKNIYMAGQTSGAAGRYYNAPSGVYDYLFTEFYRNTGKFDFHQNGDSNDQEIYSLAELSNTKIAFCGRTTGTLSGDSAFGGYDLFLGIWDVVAESAEYYQIGSGQNDRAMHVVDLNSTVNNTLGLLYTSYGGLQGNTNSGSEDLGIIKFNYVTDTWDSAYQFGSNTQDLIEQNSHPAVVMPDGRIACVSHTAGNFADNATTFGFLDICLAIVDPTDGTIEKYQTGTGAADFTAAVSVSGSQLLITGTTEAVFDGDTHGIFVEFDHGKGIFGKRAEAS